MHQTVYHLLAAGCSNVNTLGGCATSGNTNQLWSTSIGGFIGGILSALGILILVIAVIRGIMDVLGGKPGKAVKLILGAAVLAVFMLQPAFFGDLVSLMATAVKDVINSISQITGGSGGGSSPATTVAGG